MGVSCKILVLSIFLGLILCCPAFAEMSAFDKCMLEEMKKAENGSASIESLKARCSAYLDKTESMAASPGKSTAEEKSAIDKRLADESKTMDSAFVLTPHRPNYIMPYTYNPSKNETPFNVDDDEIDNEEIKFQISIKYLLFDRVFGNTGDIYVAYTNQSYWQAYNTDQSSPFRETNHEPEAWMQFRTDSEIGGGVKLGVVSFGINHQSNGRGMENISRSWNRVFMNLVFEKGDWALSLKPWYRLPEDDEDDNNPSIEKYVGYGELRTGYKWRDHVFSLMLRNNLRESGNMGAVELGWSFPLYKKIRGYVQHYNGYCESLIDYDSSSNRFGIGIMLADAM